MNKTLIARNLIILKQLEQTALCFHQAGIPTVALKGSALLCLKEEYLAERSMEDIDLLVRPADLSRARSVLSAMEYDAAPDDPCAFVREGSIPVDITDHLWYMSEQQHRQLWDDGRLAPLPGMPRGTFHLPFDEFYVHVVAHAAIHHVRREKLWMRDLEVIKEIGGGSAVEDAAQRKLASYGLANAVRIFFHGKGRLRPSSIIYRWLLHSQHPESGHIARFMFLSLRRKCAYLLKTIFPPDDFIRCRYSLTSCAQVRLFKALRPFLLFKKLFLLALR